MQFVHFVQYSPYSLFYFQLLLLQQRAQLLVIVLADLDTAVFKADAFLNLVCCRSIQPGSLG
jgi:hypothetical protein